MPCLQDTRAAVYSWAEIQTQDEEDIREDSFESDLLDLKDAEALEEDNEDLDYTSEEVAALMLEMQNPCDRHRCKRGRVCELGTDSKPVCVCHDSESCSTSEGMDEKVCGTDNRTYDSSCHLFAHKCSLDGTKKGRKLHLDYYGPCKKISECLPNELAQFPLRMRDWLKNVLIQMYEQDRDGTSFLNDKQRHKVKKIFEDEKRLKKGIHNMDLLARDFKKNYRMYIYPIHWQFAQLDIHPVNRYLTHSELSPLRAPLVPMEHCTTPFFKQCDNDGDRKISLEEWGRCFGLLIDDIEPELVF
uniref:Secreted protein, acidic, cysteine-rich (osteonectin) n=1 Tax=Eptatretus burgeri TaxID=7764 RepID=A0A8C4N3T9_EPTBU